MHRDAYKPNVQGGVLFYTLSAAGKLWLGEVAVSIWSRSGKQFVTAENESILTSMLSAIE